MLVTRNTVAMAENLVFAGCDFASRENLKNIKAAGVTDVMFCKKRGLEIMDMVKSKSREADGSLYSK